MRFERDKIDPSVTQREKRRILHHVGICYPLLGPAKPLLLSVFEMEFKHPVAQRAGELNRIHPRHVDMTRIQDEHDLFRIGVRHKIVDLMPVLQLAPHVGVNTKLEPFLADARSKFVQDLSHLFQVIICCAAGPSSPHIDLQMFAA